MHPARSLPLRSGEKIHLYLLHWRGGVPLVETIEGFPELKLDGMIRRWGVSNFDIDELIESSGVPGGDEVQAYRVLYKLTRRGAEYALLPWRSPLGIPTMADSPIKQVRLLGCSTPQPIALQHNATPAQIAPAWALQHDGVNAIPRPPSHIRSNATAGDIELTRNDLYTLDRVLASYPAASARSSVTAPSVQVSPLWPWLSAAEFRS
jgi:diketogulonate reductase-like aldo/keto reductase